MGNGFVFGENLNMVLCLEMFCHQKVVSESCVTFTFLK